MLDMMILESKMNLAGSWIKLWNPINSAAPKVLSLVAAIGVGIIVISVCKFFWDKRRGGGGNTQGLLFAVLIGAVLSGPNIILPLLLKLADAIVNVIMKFLGTV